MKEKIIAQVCQVLVETLKLSDTNAIHRDARLREDLGLDSMSSLIFLMALEEGIPGFVVNPETLDVEDLFDVTSISNYVQQELLSRTMGEAV